MKFKKNDTVRIRKDSKYYTDYDAGNPKDTNGVITSTRAWVFGDVFFVQWDNGNINSYNQRDLEFVNKEEMKTIYKLIKIYPGHATLGKTTTKDMSAFPEFWEEIKVDTRLEEALKTFPYKVGDTYRDFRPQCYSSHTTDYTGSYNRLNKDGIDCTHIKFLKFTIFDNTPCAIITYFEGGSSSIYVPLQEFLDNDERSKIDFSKYKSLNGYRFSIAKDKRSFNIGCQTYTLEDLNCVQRTMEIGELKNIKLREVLITKEILDNLKFQLNG